MRDKSAVKIEPLFVGDGAAVVPHPDLVRIRFDLERCSANGGKVAVSRVDGNHRLYFAAGDDRRDPILAMAPFQLHLGLTREQEAALFVDLNANQKGLNSSHLSVLRSNLTEEELEIRDHPARWMARRLADKDSTSPWFGIVHMGGSKVGARTQGLTRMMNFASLEAGVARTLAKSLYLHDLTDPQAQYVVLRHYWTAVKQVFADEWAHPKQHLLLKCCPTLRMSMSRDQAPTSAVSTNRWLLMVTARVSLAASLWSIPPIAGSGSPPWTAPSRREGEGWRAAHAHAQ